MAHRAQLAPHQQREITRRRDRQFSVVVVDYDDDGCREYDYRCNSCREFAERTEDGDPYCSCPDSDVTLETLEELTGRPVRPADQSVEPRVVEDVDGVSVQLGDVDGEPGFLVFDHGRLNTAIASADLALACRLARSAARLLRRTRRDGADTVLAMAAGYGHVVHDPAWHTAQSILENEQATAEENPGFEPRTGRAAHDAYDGVFDCSTGTNPDRWERVGRYLDLDAGDQR